MTTQPLRILLRPFGFNEGRTAATQGYKGLPPNYSNPADKQAWIDGYVHEVRQRLEAGCEAIPERGSF